MEETASKRDRDLWKETDRVVGRETAGESKEQQTRMKFDDCLISPDGIYAVIPVPNTEE